MEDSNQAAFNAYLTAQPRESQNYPANSMHYQPEMAQFARTAPGKDQTRLNPQAFAAMLNKPHTPDESINMSMHSHRSSLASERAWPSSQIGYPGHMMPPQAMGMQMPMNMPGMGFQYPNIMSSGEMVPPPAPPGPMMNMQSPDQQAILGQIMQRQRQLMDNFYSQGSQPDFESQLNSLSSQLNELQNNNADLRDQIVLVSEAQPSSKEEAYKIEILKQEAAQAKMQENKSLSDIQQCEKQVESARLSFEQLRREHEDEMQRLSNEADLLRKKSEYIHVDVMQLKAERDQYIQINENLANKLQDILNQGPTFSTESYMQEINSLKAKITANESRLSNLRASRPQVSHAQQMPQQEPVHQQHESSFRFSEQRLTRPNVSHDQHVPQQEPVYQQRHAQHTPQQEPVHMHRHAQHVPQQEPVHLQQEPPQEFSHAYDPNRFEKAIHWTGSGAEANPARKSQITYSKYQRQAENEGAIHSLESKLTGLHVERERKQNEFNKLPEIWKTIASKRRKDDLELEISILDTNIASLKQKLRTYNVQ